MIIKKKGSVSVLFTHCKKLQRCTLDDQIFLAYFTQTESGLYIIFIKNAAPECPQQKPPTFPFLSGVSSGEALCYFRYSWPLLFYNALSMPMSGQVEKRGVCCGHHPFKQISGPKNLPQDLRWIHPGKGHNRKNR